MTSVLGEPHIEDVVLRQALFFGAGKFTVEVKFFVGTTKKDVLAVDKCIKKILQATVEYDYIPAKKRGRPKGSKNKEENEK